MKNYIGVKEVSAEPQTFGESTGHPVPNAAISKGTYDQEGYKVVYEDGYTSWSPKDVFEKAYRETQGLTFGLAIEALKLGKKVARQGWNGKNMFLYYVKPNSYPVERNSNSPVKGLFENDLVPYSAYMALKTAQDDIAMWSPSCSDALAEDWYILED